MKVMQREPGGCRQGGGVEIAVQLGVNDIQNPPSSLV